MIYIPISLIVVFLAVIIIKAYMHKPVENSYEKLTCKYEINVSNTALKLSEAIKSRTISHSDYSEFDFTEFDRFHEILKKSFPLVHSELELVKVNDYSLLYKWNGNNDKLLPGMFMAHIDVVPIEKGTENDWTYEPFSGAIEDGFVWGRGAMDIKVQVITMLEACELLLSKGFKPNRTLYFSFGHDEETDGRNGARKVLDHLIKNDIELEFVMDEGGCVNIGGFPSVSKPVAFMGIAEKGYLNVRVDIKGEGGHASTPPVNSSLGLAAKAICRLEKKKMRLRLIKPVKTMIEALGRHMALPGRLVLANLWIFKPVFTRLFTKPGTTGEALLRTTIAPTMAEGSMEPNVLPQTSSFTVNCRILQGETSADVIKHIAWACRGMDFTTTILRYEEPSSVSSHESEFFRKAAGAVMGISEDIAIVPYLMVAGTDSIKFQGISKDTIRFTPYIIEHSDLNKIHGTNERISIENIGNCVSYYSALFNSM